MPRAMQMAFCGERAGKFRHQPRQFIQAEPEAEIKVFANIPGGGHFAAITGQREAFNPCRCAGIQVKLWACAECCAEFGDAAGEALKLGFQGKLGRCQRAMQIKARGGGFEAKFFRQYAREHGAGAKRNTALQRHVFPLGIEPAGKRQFAKGRA